jgi:hypothetical protein
MKNVSYNIVFCLILLSSIMAKAQVEPSHYYGAWTTEIEIDGELYECIKTYTPTYFIYGVYAKKDNSFYSAGGGSWVITKKGITETYEFNSMDSSSVGTTVGVIINNHESEPLITHTKVGGVVDTKVVWMRLDKEESPLFGAWRITDRERNGTMSKMKMGPRKTYKVLSGTRFQWAAYNVETKQFMGTGGGTYTAKDGKYTENIGFFSRDNSRVGATLGFDYEIDGNEWHHKGLSSKGQPIYEIWTKQ